MLDKRLWPNSHSLWSVCLNSLSLDTCKQLLEDCLPVSSKLPDFFLQLPYLLVSDPAFVVLWKEESHFKSAKSPTKPVALIKSSLVSEAEVKN